MAESATVTLAGEAYEIKPLTLGQIEELSIAIVLPEAGDPQDDVRRSFERSINVLAAALRVSHPELTPQALREMTITREELNAAHFVALQLSGLIKKETAPGEAAPAGKPAA